MWQIDQNMFQEEKVVFAQTQRTKFVDDIQGVHRYACHTIP